METLAVIGNLWNHKMCVPEARTKRNVSIFKCPFKMNPALFFEILKLQYFLQFKNAVKFCTIYLKM